MNTTKRLILSSFLALAFAGCSGASLIDTDPNLNEGVPTGQLQVEAVHHAHDGSAIAPNALGEKEIHTDLGYHLLLQEAHLNWRELSLISSGADPECAGGNDQVIPLDQVEDFLGEDLIGTALATVNVPIVGYCEYELVIAGTPVAAVKFHEGMEKSFHLNGTWEKDAASGTFQIEGSDTVVINAHFQAKEGEATIDHPLHFHEGETEKTLSFGNAYDTFFDGIDFATEAEAAQISKFIENLKAGIHQHRADETGDGHSH